MIPPEREIQLVGLAYEKPAKPFPFAKFFAGLDSNDQSAWRDGFEELFNIGFDDLLTNNFITRSKVRAAADKYRLYFAGLVE